MTYVVLARKWRPMSFADLVGQDHVATTLANAIAHDRVAHAFLFTGVRGVGKTTSARILAKALNCLSSAGPTATPCLECAACKEIALGTDVDVQEIDGASYNGVDEVRRLQESLPYRPSRDRYKIIIVDEVHMLTQSAWNAFLKTLEEPPPHVKFIFATTEVHKVPVTILSRVQRFDFKLIPAKLIIERLRYMLTQEKLTADDEALAMLARQAAGSMRDATSLLDQVIAWSDGNLTAQGVSQSLGIASRTVMYDLARSVLSGDATKALHVVDAIARQGFEIPHVAKDFLALLRDVVVAATCSDPSELLDLPEEEQRDVKALATQPLDDLLRVHQGFSLGYDDVVRAAFPRAALEMLLIRLARRPPLVPVDDLLDRLVQLEKRLRQAGASSASGNARPVTSQHHHSQSSAPNPPAQRQGPPAGARREAGATPAPRPSGGGRSADEEGEPAVVSPPAEPAPPRPAANAAASGEATTPRVPTPPSDNPTSRHAITQRQPAASQPEKPATPALPAPQPRRPPGALPDGGNGSARSVAPTRSAPPPSDRRNGVANDARSEMVPSRSKELDWHELPIWERWRRIVDPIRQTDAGLGAFLDHAVVLEVSSERLRVGFERDSVFRSAANEPNTRSQILRAAEQVLGSKPTLEWVDGAPLADGAGQTVFAVDKAARLTRHREALDRARSHPVVEAAVRVLGARVKNIEIPES